MMKKIDSEVIKLRTENAFVLIFVLGLLLPIVPVSSPVTQERMTTPHVPPLLVEDTSLAAEGEPGPLLTNIMNNPSFERRSASGIPYDYSYYGTFSGGVNSTYQGLTYSGIYASRIWGRGSSTSNAWAYQYWWDFDDRGFVDEGLVLDFYWFVQEAGAIDQNSACYLYIEMYNESTSNWNSIYYLLNFGSMSLSNSTNQLVFRMNDTDGQWNHFGRNITEDYMDYPAFYLDSTRRVNAIYFYINVNTNVEIETSWVIDDVSIVNGTAHEYIVNGDFEGGDMGYWQSWTYSPSEVITSTDSTHGEYSLNMSCTAEGPSSAGYAALYESKSRPWESYFPDVNPVIVEFDWKYIDSWNGGGSNAYFRVRSRNEAGTSHYLYYRLGDDTDGMFWGNSSTTVNTYADEYGSRGIWHHATIDLSSLFEEVSWDDFTAYDFQFYITLGNYANASVQLLVDDFKVLTYTTGDPGFEVTAWDSGSTPLGVWPHWNGDATTNLRTTDAHSGMYAANLTVTNGQSSGIFREDFFTTMDPEMTSDFWWKTNKMEIGPSSTSYSRFRLEFDFSYRLYIYTVRGMSHNPSNSSNDVYIFPDDVNTTGVWTNLRMNLSGLADDAFGPGLYNMTRVVIDAFAASGDNLTVIYDDIGFADAGGPLISSVSLDPTTPVFHSSTEVTATVTDTPAGVWQVELYYRVDGGSWNPVEMMDVGSPYSGTIPMVAYGSLVEYYINATDWTGQISIDDNGGSYYSFTVDDDIDPTVNFETPEHADTVSGLVVLEASADDLGSGVEFVDFFVDGEYIGEDDTAPYQVVWNSREVQNGSRVLTVFSNDFEGLWAVDTITVNVQNDVAPPVLSQVILNPTEPQYDQPYTISVGVTDASDVENVTIHFRSTIGGTTEAWDSVAMLHDGALYYQSFPGRDWDTLVEYYIVAYDIYGAAEAIGSEVVPLAFVVSDTIAPELGVSGPSPLDIVRDTVQFVVSAVDPGSGIGSIQFLVDGTLEATTTSDTVSWNTLDFENGNYTLTFTAVDNAGNSASLTLEYQVSNPVGLDAISETLSDIMEQYGFIIGAATVVVLYIVVKVLLRRRKSG
jgi:hypothetical protein